MSNRKRAKRQSIADRVRMFGLLFLLLILVDFIFSQVSLQRELSVDTQTDYRTGLEIAIERMEDEYSKIGENLYLRMSSSEALVYLESGKDPNQLIIHEVLLVNEMEKLITNERLVNLMMFYTPDGSKQSFLSIGSLDYAVKRAVEEHIRQEVDGAKGNTDLRKGQVYSVGESHFVLHFYRVKKSYFVTVTLIDTLLDHLRVEMNDEEIVLLESPEGIVYASSNPEKFDKMAASGKDRAGYLVVQSNVQGDGLIVSHLISKHMLYADLYRSWIFFFVWMLVLLVLFLVAMYALRRFVTTPVIEIVDKLSAIREENWEEKIEVNTNFTEYETLVESYNSMIDRVAQLKLENYEKQVATQKLQLQFLQLQVKPHFYMNALNIIYSLAQVEDYELIQKMTMSLIEYSRYMYRDAIALVRLEEEIAFVRNYIAIQQLRYLDKIEYIEDLDESLNEALIPPFVIETFVENSIKYGVVQQGKRKVSLSVSAVENGFMKIVVRDNGEGFDECLLQKINQNIDLKDPSGNHIGIQNAKDRLRIIFGNRVRVTVSNVQGAVVTLFIPYE